MGDNNGSQSAVERARSLLIEAHLLSTRPDRDAVFAALNAQLVEAQKLPDKTDVVDRSLRIARARTRLLPGSAIAPAARTLLNEMTSWGVPQSVLSAHAELASFTSSSADDVDGARASLNKLMEDYDYWDVYSDTFFAKRNWLVWSLFVLALVSVLSAHLCLVIHQVFFGLVLASVAGAATSILIKLPAMSAIGDENRLANKAATRLVVGVVGGAVAAGALSLGLVTVPLPDDSGVTLLQVLDVCSASATTLPDVRSSDAGATAPAVVVADAGDAIAGASDSAAHEQTGNQTELDVGVHSASTPCLPRYIYILLALGVLLGFSERFLSTVESAIFKEKGDGASSG